MFSLQYRPFVTPLIKKPIATNKKPFLHKSPRKLIVPRASGIDWNFSSYIVGKGIILFTIYYCSMNWWFYRRTREDIEKDKKDKN